MLFFIIILAYCMYVHLLQKCSRSVNDKMVFCTFDVESLCSDISHECGLKAMQYWFNKDPDSVNSKFPKAFIMVSIQFVLKNSNFKFNDKQLVGTATGTDMAPTFAIMRHQNVKFYNLCEVNWGKAIRVYIEEAWGRFLDDCEIPLDEDKLQPKALCVVLNSINPNKQFTMTHGIENNKLWMDLCTKATDTRKHLPYSSAHPKYRKINIPSCLARRTCTIVENEQTKRKHLEELKQIMLQQKYPLNQINRGIDKVLAIPQSELTSPKS